MGYPEITEVSVEVDDFLQDKGFISWLLIDDKDIESVWEEVQPEYGGGRETLPELLENIDNSEDYQQGLAEAMNAAFYQFTLEWADGFLHDYFNERPFQIEGGIDNDNA